MRPLVVLQEEVRIGVFEDSYVPSRVTSGYLELVFLRQLQKIFVRRLRTNEDRAKAGPGIFEKRIRLR